MNNKFKDIFGLIEKLQPLQKKAVEQTWLYYKQEVDLIINSNDRCKKRIEKTLDALLDLAFDNNILKLFKKLCRYYYFISPQATVDYVLAYREIWDEEVLANEK